MIKIGRVKINLKIVLRNIAVLSFFGVMMYFWMQYLWAIFGD